MYTDMAYVIITPHTIRKSRTGAVLERLLSRIASPLIGAQMVALTREFAETYANSLLGGTSEHERWFKSLLRDYVSQNLGPSPEGRRHRSLFLVFAGKNVQNDVKTAVGNFVRSDIGESVRDAYGDLILNPDGSVRYFEPAVLISRGDCEEWEMWLNFLKDQPALLERICEYNHPELVQQTLVLLKPDAWQQRSLRPGAIVDMFSRTGLRIIGCHVLRMSINQGLRFYEPVRDVLKQKLSPKIAEKAKAILEKELHIQLPQEIIGTLQSSVGLPYAEAEFEKLIEYMTGRKLSQTPEHEREMEGLVSCMALVYEGENAVQKIREVLGPTDPQQAPYGTVRREFGSNIMVNAAHASDSPANAQREIEILNLRRSSIIQRIERILNDQPPYPGWRE